jgi:hypothetical protein
MNPKTIIVTPWHNPDQLSLFLKAWGIDPKQPPDFLHLQQDKTKQGCAKTKNAGIRAAMKKGAEIIIILDDDCFPCFDETLREFAEEHEAALEPQSLPLFEAVTDPPSRGTPYFQHTCVMEVAASMGFWEHVGDYDAPAQLVRGQLHPMIFSQKVIHGRYFPLCGMNLAFRVEEWPWCQFIDVERFDDIWQGFLWQRKAYTDGKCFNLRGPTVRHSRQSNVWHNLRVEAANLERNETIWQRAATEPINEYEAFKKRVLG